MSKELKTILMDWRKSKQGQDDWLEHIVVFLEGAIATAKACQQESLENELRAALADVEKRGFIALADLLATGP